MRRAKFPVCLNLGHQFRVAAAVFAPAILTAASFLTAAFAPVAHADIIYESGTLGPTGLSLTDLTGTPPLGSGVSTVVFSGVRFEILQPVLTTRIGGHFIDQPQLLDDSFFGAIVRLDDATDFPDSGDLSTPDVLGTALLNFPDLSDEVFGDLEKLLEPGWYALVFGSGLFGATGGGSAVLNNPDVGSPAYIAFQPGFGWVNFSDTSGLFKNFRLVVEGQIVPEPSSAVAALLAATLMLGYRRTSYSLEEPR